MPVRGKRIHTTTEMIPSEMDESDGEAPRFRVPTMIVVKIRVLRVDIRRNSQTQETVLEHLQRSPMQMNVHYDARVVTKKQRKGEKKNKFSLDGFLRFYLYFSLTPSMYLILQEN